jgi:hypothetical protein
MTSGGWAISISTPSKPVADAIELLVRLEVNIGYAGRDGVDQDLLQVLDDRRVLDLRSFPRRRWSAPPVSGSWRSTSRSSIEDFTSLSSAPEASTSLWIDWASLSLSTTTGSMTRFVLKRISRDPAHWRIGGGDVQPVAALVQRQNVPRLGNLEVDQLFRELIGIEAGKSRTTARRTPARRTRRAASP